MKVSGNKCCYVGRLFTSCSVLYNVVSLRQIYIYSVEHFLSRLLNKNMGGDHGHHHKYEVPDYRIYKVEDCPKLVNVQRALAQKGLTDPWLRNEVWRFHPSYKTDGYRARLAFFRGIQWGFAAFVATIAIEKLWDTVSPSDHSHGHH